MSKTNRRQFLATSSIAATAAVTIGSDAIRRPLAAEDKPKHKEKPLPREQFSVYDFDNVDRPERAGQLDAIFNHMGNFFDCIESRRTPISNFEAAHRTVSTRHLANISMRIGRPLKWNPETEQFVGDSETDGWLKREQREGFEVA